MAPPSWGPINPAKAPASLAECAAACGPVYTPAPRLGFDQAIERARGERVARPGAIRRRDHGHAAAITCGEVAHIVSRALACKHPDELRVDRGASLGRQCREDEREFPARIAGAPVRQQSPGNIDGPWRDATQR